MNHNPHDRKIKEAFEEREIQPKNSLWDRIEAELDAPETLAPVTPVNDRRYFWQIAAAIVVLLGVGLIWNLTQSGAPTTVVTEEIVQTTPPVSQPIETPLVEKPAVTEIAAVAPNKPHQPVVKPAGGVTEEVVQPAAPTYLQEQDEQLMQLAVQFDEDKTVRVNGRKLLQAVDQTPKVQESTPREQLFRKLGNTYNQVHYAISNRNYENE